MKIKVKTKIKYDKIVLFTDMHAAERKTKRKTAKKIQNKKTRQSGRLIHRRIEGHQECRQNDHSEKNKRTDR